MSKNVIITGANRGIGKAMVEAFAKNGDNIWACARTQSEEFEAFLSELTEKYGIWAEPVYLDVTDAEQVKKAFTTIRSKKVSVDVLVNNAGIGHMGVLQMTSMEKVREIFEVNLFSAIQMTQMAQRLMMRQGSGAIINIASVAAQEINAGNTVYGASKAALVAFTKNLAAELAPHHITVNAVGPSLVSTEMSAVFEGDDPALAVSRTGIGRKVEPKEVADVVVELTKDSMRIVNGQLIIVNGGSK